MESDIAGENTALLLENTNAANRAVAIYKKLNASLLALLTMDATLLGLYLVFFNVMEDKQWYDWMEFFQVFVILAMAVALYGTARIYRYLEYILLAVAFAFIFDIIGTAYLRTLEVDRTNPANVRKKNVKQTLLVFQAIFFGFDIVLFIVAAYFRFFAKLEGSVLRRFQDIPVAEKVYLENAIMLKMQESAEEAVNMKMAEYINNKIEVDKSLELVKTIYGTPASQAPAPPPSVPLITVTPPPAEVKVVQQATSAKYTQSKKSSTITRLDEMLGYDGSSEHEPASGNRRRY